MKYIICAIFIFCFCKSYSQLPVGVPTQKINGWIENWYTVPDSGTVITRRDTSWTPRFFGTTVTWPHAGVDTVQWFWVGNHWVRSTSIQSDSSFAYIDYIPQATNPAYNEGRLFYDDANKTLTLFDAISSTSLQIGQEQYVRVRNNTGSQVNDGSAVYINGATGQMPTIALARSNALATSKTIGLAAHDISNNSIGKITTFGLVNDVNTSSFSAGDRLYVSPLTPGALTNVEPDVPNFSVFVGYCLYSHVNQGKILVAPQQIIVQVHQLNDTSFTAIVGSIVDTIRISGSGPGSGGTVTSVGLSMPSAFNVSPSTITTSGTFGVTGAGTSSQYIRGNGTLATFDTTAIPNFYLKVRGLLSATSPLSYNSTTGIFSVGNANTAGTRGVATFSSTDFSDNGLGLISLRVPFAPIVSNGIRKPNDTVKLGTGNESMLDSTVIIQYKAHKSSGFAYKNLLITNVPSDTLPRGASWWEYPVITSETSLQPQGINVAMMYKESWGDTMGLLYGGPIATYHLQQFDSVSPRFAQPGGRFITLPYTGINSSNRIFLPKDSVNIYAGANGSQAGEIVADWAVGDSCGYNAHIFGLTNSYPLAAIISHIDLQRNISRERRRKITGNGVAGFFADYKDYQGAITPTTFPDSAYHSKIYDYYSAGERIENGLDPATTKAYILSISKNDTVVGFYSAPKYTVTNNVYNGYGFVSDGTNDFNLFSGRVKIGGLGVWPTRLNTTTTYPYQLYVDSTLLIGRNLAGSTPGVDTTTYVFMGWQQYALSGSTYSQAANRKKGLVINYDQSYSGTSNNNFTGASTTSLRSWMWVRANDTLKVSNSVGVVGLTGVEAGLLFRKNTGFTDTTIFIGGTLPTQAPSAFVTRMDMADGTSGAGKENLYQGYFASITPTFQFLGTTNKVDHAIWMNLGVMQTPGAGAVTNGYEIYMNALNSNIVNKYAMYQEGTADTVLFNGRVKISNMSAPPSTYNIVIHGSDSVLYQVPSSSLFGNTIYTGDGTLLADRNIASGGFTLRLSGANNSDTLLSIVNTGTSSTGLFSLGSMFGVDAQSTTTGLRAFGSATGMTAEGGTNEGAIIKSDAIRGATIQSVPSTTNTVQEVIRFERGVNGSPGAAGIGGSANFYNKVSDNSSVMSNELISKFTTATVGSRFSQFSITGVNAAVTGTILTIDGDGTITTAGKRIMSLVTSSAGTLTIGNAEAYIFNGTTTTWTLPPVSGTTGTIYYLKNIGSGTITLNADSGSNEIYSTSAVNTLAITAGTSVILISNGTYFTTN